MYSYAVFQHIPSRDVVMQYLREASRVLKTGGLLRCQINGLDKTAKTYDTWSGVRIGADEVRDYALENDMQLLALEGVRTQYMWTTMRKRSPGWRDLRGESRARIRRVTNAHNSEPVVPAQGPVRLVHGLDRKSSADCDLIGLDVRVGGEPATPCYIGPPESDGLQQLNVLLRKSREPVFCRLEILWNGDPVCEPASLRVIPPGPLVPHVMSVTDGINMLSGSRISSGSVKVTIEEAEHPETFRASIDGGACRGTRHLLRRPTASTARNQLRCAAGFSTGPHQLAMSMGHRKLGVVTLEIVKN